MSTYAYVNNQPTMQTDPLGLMGSRGNPTVNQAGADIYAQVGAGASVMAGVVGGGVTVSGAASTGGQMCRVVTYCGRIGLGLYAGAGGVVGGGGVSGNTQGLGGWSVGVGADIGAGASAGGGVGVGLPGPSSIGGVVGKGGGGVGVDAGVDICYTTTKCTKEKNTCEKP